MFSYPPQFTIPERSTSPGHPVANRQIPEDLRRFILTTIPSVPHLEALLLLRRDQHTRWSASLVARRLYIDETNAGAVLRHLADAGFVHFDTAAGEYRYAPASPTSAEMIDRLADLYAQALVAVTNIIHGRPAQLFADAFKFRKD